LTSVAAQRSGIFAIPPEHHSGARSAHRCKSRASRWVVGVAKRPVGWATEEDRCRSNGAKAHEETKE
jgi:hypothetical protein